MPWKNKEAQKAYAVAYYQKRKNDPEVRLRRKNNLKKWRENNRLKTNEIARRNYNPIRSKKKWQEVKEKHNAKRAKEVADLAEIYVIKLLKLQGWTIEQIKENPNIISTHRQILKTKRLCKKSRTLQRLEKI